MTCVELIQKYHDNYVNKLRYFSNSLTMEEAIKEDQFKEIVVVLDKLILECKEKSSSAQMEEYVASTKLPREK